MYKVAYLYQKTHAKLIQLKNAGRIQSMTSFIDSAVNKAITGLEAPLSPAQEIVITIKVKGGECSEEKC